MATRSELIESSAHYRSLAASRHDLAKSYRSRRIATEPIDPGQAAKYGDLAKKYFTDAAGFAAQADRFTRMAEATVENSDETEIQSPRSR